MSRLREHKQRLRGGLHREMSVPALYFPVPSAEPIACTVRVWLKGENVMVGQLTGSGLNGAERAESEDALRFDLSEFATPLRRNALVSVAEGEAYRLDHLYPVDLGWQTARVLRLSANEIESFDLAVPADA